MSNDINEIYGLITDKFFCDGVINFFNLKRKENLTKDWDGFYGKTLQHSEISDDILRKQIKCLVYRITQEFFNRHKISIYPENWDITYWAPGTMFESHVDNIGDLTYEKNKRLSSVKSRYYTAVCYLNDDFTGGETFMTDLNYKCKPEKEKIFIFPSNLYHGVTEIKTGGRYTLTMWFTKNENFLME